MPFLPWIIGALIGGGLVITQDKVNPQQPAPASAAPSATTLVLYAAAGLAAVVAYKKLVKA